MTRDLHPCGTPAAYQRHRYHGETPCDECKKANRVYRVSLLRSTPEARRKYRDAALANANGFTLAAFRERQSITQSQEDRALRRRMEKEGL